MTQEIENKISNIKSEISRKFEYGGCRIENAHFENGRNLHSEQYYFAKNYFQNNKNCTELAEVLCSKLNDLEFSDDTTLIGFRNYSGLLLKETTKQLGKFNHAIIEENEGSFFWRHLPSLHKNLIIVLPIACSCITYIRLRKFLTDYCSHPELKEKDIKVNNNFIVVFLILEESLNNIEHIIKINEENDESKLKHIYSAFNWTEINKEQIIFNAQSSEGNDKSENKESNRYKANSLVRLYSKMQLPEECNLCFPTISINEKPLFPTHDNYENPNLIFRFPNFSESPKQRNFLDTFCSNVESCNVILRGHIDVNKTSFSNYIRGNTFYKNNRPEILDFFENEIKTQLFKDNKKDGEPDDHIIFITSENKHSSYFLEDLALSKTFHNKKVTILRFQASNEFVDNFVSLYSDSFTDKENPPKIIYFEDVMSAGKAFKLVSNYIKHARIGKLSKEEISNEQEVHGFDFVLTLVDRTPAYTKSEILRKLYSEVNRKPEEKFISFFRLNVPILSVSHLGNPLERKIDNLKELMNQCHLDSLKATVGSEILKRLPTNLPELGSENKMKKRLDYFPFGIIEKEIQKDLFELYQPYFKKNSLDLLTLYLAHKINSELFNIDYDEKKYQNNPEQFITELIISVENSIEGKIDNYFISDKNRNSPKRNLDAEKDIVVDTIVKTLSTPPFIYYKNIYEPVFYYCVKELDKLCSKIEADGEIKSFKTFRKLKFFIRRSIELNSNFIVSKKFLGLLKEQYTKKRFKEIIDEYEIKLTRLELLKKDDADKDYYHRAIASLNYKHEEVTSFFSYLLFYYKQLMSKNPAVSIKLEELINSKDLLPKEMEIYNNPNGNLEKLIDDPYFQFTGMVKAENLFLLNELKKLHEENLEERNNNKKISRSKQKANENVQNSTLLDDENSIRRYYFRGNK